MNRRSWFKSTLATIVLAVSDGIPKILASNDIKIQHRKMKVTFSIEPYHNPKFECINAEIYKCRRKVDSWILVSNEEH